MSFDRKLERESCVANVLSEADILCSVRTLRRVCESCLGPHGKCHMIHNDVGGHVVITSAAERLFSASQVSSPVLRLLISAVQHHITTHSDGATSASTLALLMTERALHLSLQRQQTLVVNLFDAIVEAATSYLTSDQCPVHCKLQLDNLNGLLRLLRGFLVFFVDNVIYDIVELFCPSVTQKLKLITKSMHFEAKHEILAI